MLTLDNLHHYLDLDEDLPRAWLEAVFPVQKVPFNWERRWGNWTGVTFWPLDLGGIEDLIHFPLSYSGKTVGWLNSGEGRRGDMKQGVP